MKNDSKSNICRACMSENTIMVSLFDFVPSSSDKSSNADMIMTCTSVQIASGDGLPEEICLDCANHINQCYLFKLKCENSDLALRTKFGITELKQEDDNKDEVQLIISENGLIKKESHTDVSDNDFEESGYFNGDETNSDCVLEKERLYDFVCEMCNKLFQYERHLKNHLKNHKYNRKFECKLCYKGYSKKVSLIAHGTSHSDKIKKHKKKSYSKKKAINKNEKKYDCDKCTRKFIEEKQLIKHMNEKHMCTVCMKKVIDLKIHLRSHNGEKTFLCPTCGKGFSQIGNLKQHMLRHDGIKSFICDVCEMSFVSKGSLVVHQRIHSGDKPYQCDICSSSFARSDTLNNHREFVHFGKKGYECDICHKNFSYSHSLACHKRIHSGEKPFSCKFCEKTFTQKTTLTTHLRIHTGEKPYVCNACGQVFGQRSTLRSHRKKEKH